MEVNLKNVPAVSVLPVVGPTVVLATPTFYEKNKIKIQQSVTEK